MNYPEIFEEYPLYTLSNTIAHEIGHQFGLNHGYKLVPVPNGGGVLKEDLNIIDPLISTSELNNWGLMSSGSNAGTDVSFINSRQINLIRLRVKSPGKD